MAEQAIQPLYRFCFHRVGRDSHLCEEIVHETLIRAIRDVDRYDPNRSGNDIFPWLTGLARNEIQRAVAQERAADSLQEMWAKMDGQLKRLYALIESEPFSDEMLCREETRQMVNATMSQLPSQYRHALEAKYVAGQSVREIAASLATTEKAVESQLSRARRAFRETFWAMSRNLDLEAS